MTTRPSSYDRGFDDDDDAENAATGPNREFKEFDCPDCNANNPHEGFRNGAELLCNYCGTEFEARVDSEGRLKLRER